MACSGEGRLPSLSFASGKGASGGTFILNVHVPRYVVNEVSHWLFTEPILPLAILVDIGKRHQSTRCQSARLQPISFRCLEVVGSRLILRDKWQLA
jgi:hypothetical protein